MVLKEEEESMAGTKKENVAEHTHEHEHGHTHEHGEHHDHHHDHHHDYDGHHTHSHTHDPAEIKKIVNSLSRTIGHLESTKKMLIDGQDCADVLIQLAAIKGEVNNAGKALLKEHLEHCIVEAVAEDDKEAVDKMNKAIDMFMK